MAYDKSDKAGTDRNPDPITGAPGSHPGGTAIGGVSGAATGAAIGSIGGPVGAIIGGVAGAVVGGGVGHAAGEWNDPTEDEAYWRNNYTDRPYVRKGESYDDYADAYRYGGTAARTHAVGRSSAATAGRPSTAIGQSTSPAAVGGSTTELTEQTPTVTVASDVAPAPPTSTGAYVPAARFEDRETDIRADWERTHGTSGRLGWDRARDAVKDAYDRAVQQREERLRTRRAGDAALR